MQGRKLIQEDKFAEAIQALIGEAGPYLATASAPGATVTAAEQYKETIAVRSGPEAESGLCECVHNSNERLRVRTAIEKAGAADLDGAGAWLLKVK